MYFDYLSSLGANAPRYQSNTTTKTIPTTVIPTLSFDDLSVSSEKRFILIAFILNFWSIFDKNPSDCSGSNRFTSDSELSL